MRYKHMRLRDIQRYMSNSGKSLTNEILHGLSRLTHQQPY